MQPRFIHLNLHTEYSLADGLVRIKSLVAACAKAGMPAVAVTDQMNLFAAVKFYQAAMCTGIKPIIGCDVLIYNKAQTRQPFHLILLCQNDIGYKNLTRLISRAYTEGQVSGLPMIQRDWLEAANEGLIALSAAHQGDIGQAIIKNDVVGAEQQLAYWRDIFADRFYLEIQQTGRQHDDIILNHTIAIAQKYSVPVVATNAVRFLDVEDFEAHEARVCINQSRVLEDPTRSHDYNEQQFLRSAEEMAELFAKWPGALANSVEIAKRCNLNLQLGKVCLPKFPMPENITVEDYLIQQARLGLRKRLVSLLDENGKDYSQGSQTERKSIVSEKEKPYWDRLELELDVINKMGFAGYFLIVADFIAWAKNNGVPVGPGRGSGAGSLVAYALDITDLDPLSFDLLFERFLNPERISMPDFDIDFCMEGRDRVIEYVAQRYGHDRVAQIITFGTMAAKAVVRDVGRVLGFPYGFVDKIAKLIPFELGMTLAKAMEQEEGLRDRYQQEEEVRTIIDLAKKLEGIVRNASKHAGGVVIAPSVLTDFTALYCEADGTNTVTQFDKDDVEAVGLIKFDFLGLRTLTIIDWALQTVNEKRKKKGEKIIDINTIPMDDKASFNLLKACKTTGIFQLESRGMKDLVKRLQPDCFEDVLALIALYRPGPLQSGMVDDFIDRKHGRATIVYPHPKLEAILRPTYGVILYQEQVMQIAQVLAGYTLGDADVLRRAMGKKKPEEMEKQRVIFKKGAIKRGVNAKLSNDIFNLMEKFSGYGFNKSHSAAYALVSYQTAWLKANYKAAFMAAVLSSDMDNTNKVVNFIYECRTMAIKVAPPNVNKSYYKFTVAETEDETIIYGLGAIKGVGGAAIESIITHRETQGLYIDLFDFCKRVDLRKVNRRVLEAMINAGCFDDFAVQRASLYATVDVALKFAEQHAKVQASGQADLFLSLMPEEDSANKPVYINVKPWSDEERLHAEKETLGLYLSGHPINNYLDELKNIVTAPIEKLNFDTNRSFVIAGFITTMRTKFTKGGNRMAFITIDDKTSRLELVIFSDVFNDHRNLLVKDQLLIFDVEGSYNEYSRNYRLAVTRVLTMDAARELFAKCLVISIIEDKLNNAFIARLQEVLTPFKSGKCPVIVEYTNKDSKAQIEFPKTWWVHPNGSMVDALRDLVGKDSVQFYY